MPLPNEKPPAEGEDTPATPQGRKGLLDDFDAAFNNALTGAGMDPQGGPEQDVPRDLRPLKRVDPEPDAGDPEGNADPVAAAAHARVEQDAAARGQAQTAQQGRMSKRVERFGQFLDDVESNPALRDHILKFWHGDNQQAAAHEARQSPGPEEDDPLAEYDEKDRTALNRYYDRREQTLLRKIEQIVAPFQEQMVTSAAEREFATLQEKHPDWQKWTDKKELAEIRGQFPNLSLLAAYKIASHDRVRAKVVNADRQMAVVKDVLARKAPAESQPRRHVKVDKREMSWDEAFEKAYSQVRAVGGLPGR
jgi:hypothetical protein